MVKREVNLCDVCDSEGKMVLGEDFIVSILTPGGGKPVAYTISLDEGENGHAEVVYQLLGVIEKYGKPLTGGVWDVVTPPGEGTPVVEPVKVPVLTAPTPVPSPAVLAKPVTAVGAALARAMKEKEEDDEEGKRVPIQGGEASKGPNGDTPSAPTQAQKDSVTEPETKVVTVSGYNFCKRPQKREKVPDWVKAVRATCKKHPNGNMNFGARSMHMTQTHPGMRPEEVEWILSNFPPGFKPVHCFSCHLSFAHSSQLWGHGDAAGHQAYFLE